MVNKLDPDYLAGQAADPFYANKDTEAYKQGLADREGRSLDTTPPVVDTVAPAGLALPLVFLAATVGIAVAASIYPVAAAITIGAYLIGYYAVFVPFWTNTSPLVALFMFLIPGTLIFFFSMRLENGLASLKSYRWSRHLWRVSTAALLGWVVSSVTREGPNWTPRLDALRSELLTPSGMIVMAVLALLAHLLSRRLDRAWSGAPQVWARRDARRARVLQTIFPPRPWFTIGLRSMALSALLALPVFMIHALAGIPAFFFLMFAIGFVVAARERRREGIPPALLDDLRIWFLTVTLTGVAAALGAMFAAMIDEPGTPGAVEFGLVGFAGGLGLGLLLHLLRRRRQSAP